MDRFLYSLSTLLWNLCIRPTPWVGNFLKILSYPWELLTWEHKLSLWNLVLLDFFYIPYWPGTFPPSSPIIHTYYPLTKLSFLPLLPYALCLMYLSLCFLLYVWCHLHLPLSVCFIPVRHRKLQLCLPHRTCTRIPFVYTRTWMLNRI